MSQYKGVEFIPARSKPWRASIKKGGKRYRLGYFATEHEAADAYLQKARELFGEFAYQVGHENKDVQP